MQLRFCAYCGTRAQTYCPVCESANVVPVAYGYPSDDMFSRADRGEILLGGCVLAPDASVEGCGDCGTQWKVEGESARPAISNDAHAWVTLGDSPEVPRELVGLSDQIRSLLRDPIPPLVADHQTLEVMLPEWLQNPGRGEHWYRDVDIDVACSPLCRDLLLTEGDWTPVSVWSFAHGGASRLAGRGPYLTGHSVIVLLSPDATVIGLLKDGHPVGSVAEHADVARFAQQAADSLAGWYVAPDEVLAMAPERGFQRSLIPVDFIRGQRWGALMVPIHSEDRTEECDPILIPAPSLDHVDSMTEQVIEALQVRGVAPPSRHRLAHLVSEVYDRLRQSEEWRQQHKMQVKESGRFRCLHPAIAGETCLRCGTPHRPGLGGGVEEKMATVRKYGAHSVFQGRIHIEGTPPVRGVEHLPGSRTEPDSLEWQESNA